MCKPVNDTVSDFELLGRGYYCTSQIKKNGELRECAFYPINKEDAVRKGMFTNKLSMFRLCRDINTSGVHEWNHLVMYARDFEHKKRVFKGFGVARGRFFKEKGFAFEPAATEKNPFHMHLIIPDYNEPYRKVESVSELLSEDLRSRLEDLRHDVTYIPVEEKAMSSSDFPTPCDFCSTEI